MCFFLVLYFVCFVVLIYLIIGEVLLVGWWDFDGCWCWVGTAQACQPARQQLLPSPWSRSTSVVRFWDSLCTHLSGLLQDCSNHSACPVYEASPAVADSRGLGGGVRPSPIGSYFFKKPLFLCISLCAFAISEDGADKLSSPPLFKIFGSSTEAQWVKNSAARQDCMICELKPRRGVQRHPGDAKCVTEILGGQK